MQSISGTLDTAIKGSAHNVLPYVEAEWVNGRSLTNVKAYSTSDDYVDYIKSLDPAVYFRFNDSFDSPQNMNIGPKPVSHWRMNNTSGMLSSTGAFIRDEMGYMPLLLNGNDGSHYIAGSAGVVQDNLGEVSKSIKFTNYGSSTAYARSNSPDLDNKWGIADNPNLTFECWIKPDNGSTLIPAGRSVVAYKTGLRSVFQNALQETSEWALLLENASASPASSAYPRFVIMNNSGNQDAPGSSNINVYMDIKSSVQIAAGSWSHIVVTYNSKELKMYINNALVGTSNVQNGNIIEVASGNLYVASKFLAYSLGMAGSSYLGFIDEIAIYQSSLSFDDVSRRWKSGSLNVSARSSTDVAKNYHNIKDYSAYGRTGYITNTGTANINFMPALDGNTYAPLTGRIDDGSIKFVNGTSPYSNISSIYPTSDNSSSGTSIFSGNNLTVGCYVYIATSVTANQEIAGMGDGTITAANRSWMLGINRSGATATVTANVYGSSVATTATSAAISTGAWHHILMTIGSDNRIYLMIDGNYSTVVSSSVMANTMNTNNSWPISIGYLTSGYQLTGVMLSEFFVDNANVDLRAAALVIQSSALSNDNKAINKIYNPLQVVNGQTEHTVQWAVLDALDESGNVITADGDYYFTERNEVLVDTDYEYGWWSKAKSDVSGNFASAQSIYLKFDSINANYIDIYSTKNYGPIKDFQMYYEYSIDGGATYNWSSAVTSGSAGITSLGNGSYTYSLSGLYTVGYTFGTLFGPNPSGTQTFGNFQTTSSSSNTLAFIKIRALQIFITSTLYANDSARIEEFAPRWTEDISSYVSSMEISKVRENNDSSVPLGATGANTCSLTLDNTSRRFNIENSASDLYGLIFPGMKFTAGYLYRTSSGSSPEYIQQGIFYSDTWGISSDNMTAAIQCRDFSAKLQDTMVVDGYIASEITAASAIGELALRAGVPSSKVVLDNNYSSEVIKDSPSAYWRFNETKLEPFALNFDGNLYMYSHPFGDLLMAPSGTNVLGVKKNTTYAATRVLPKTFYDFPSSEMTLDFWIKCGSTAHSKSIINFATKRYSSEFYVGVSSLGKIEVRMMTGEPGTTLGVGSLSTTTISDNIWHHIAIVIDPSLASVNQATTLQVYLDGILDTTASYGGFTGFRPSGQMLIGAAFTPGTASAGIATAPHTLNSSSIFVGSLKEIKIWGNSRTQTQIRKYMNSPINNKRNGAHSSNIYKNMIIAGAPVAYYPMDLKLNATNSYAGAYSAAQPLLRDISGYDRNGFLASSGFTSVEGPIKSEDSSRAIKFKSTNTTSYTTIPNTSSYPFEGTVNGNRASHPYNFSLFPNTLSRNIAFTAELWVKPVNAVTTPLLGKTSSVVGDREWSLSMDSSRRLVFNVYNTTALAETFTSHISNALPLNTWSHVAITIMGAKAQFYINGKIVPMDDTNNFVDSGIYMTQTTPPAPLRIGAIALTSTTYASDVSFAHIAIYNRALSAVELYNHYSKAGYDSSSTAPESNGRLLYYWPLNQGRYFQYEDFKQTGFAYRSGAQAKQNMVPNMTKFTNHMYAYTAHSVNAPLSSNSWKPSGCLAVKDYAGDKNYLTYRMGTSGDGYSEVIDSNKVVSNFGGPISSEAERSTKFDSTLGHVAYMNYTADLPMTVSQFVPLAIDMWIKPTTVTSKQYLLSREDFGATDIAGRWRLFLDADSKIKFEINKISDGTPLAITPTQGAAYASLSVNNWYHLGFTFTFASGTCTLNIYLNGILYSTYAWLTSVAALTTAQVKLIVGGYRVAGSNGFSGYISNLAIYKKLMTAANFLRHYVRGKGIRQNVYTSIGTSADSYWSEMLKIATADVGMYFFDEYGNFVYEHGRSYDDALDSQHSVVQYTLDQSQDIISASQNVELHTNKVKIKIYPPSKYGSNLSVIWAAPSNESLAICPLSTALSASSTDTISLSLTLNPAGIYEPLWPLSGIVKIDDEFIKFNKSSGSSLFELQRGYWGSAASYHPAGAVVSEAREYNVEWSSQPVYFVKYPFLTSDIFDKTVSLSNWRFNGQRGYMRAFATDLAKVSDRYIVLSGTNPVTKLNNAFEVVGVSASLSETGKQLVVEVSSDYKDNIRKYGEKILEIDNPLIQDAAYAQDLAQFLLAKYSIPCPVLEISTMGIPHLQLGDRIKIQSLDGISISNDEYWIMSINLSYDGGIQQTMTLRKVS